MKAVLLLCLLLCGGTVLATPKADAVRVDKSARTLQLIAEGKPFATFDVVFGANPDGHKQQEGDERTPEGRYILDYKKADSGYYKAIHVSYPNAADVANARSRGVDPGGLIMIHGQRNGWGWWSWLTQRFDWTNGCIAVDDASMETIWQAVEPGTPIEILP